MATDPADFLATIEPAELNNASRLALAERLLRAALATAEPDAKEVAELVIGKIRLHGAEDPRMGLVDVDAMSDPDRWNLAVELCMQISIAWDEAEVAQYDTIDFEEITARLANFVV